MERPKINRELIVATAAAFCAANGWDEDQAEDLARVCRNDRMDGYELISVLRSQPQFSKLPIVMLTSRSGVKHRQKAFDLGVTDYLVKPYQDENLLATLRRVVQQGELVR